MMAMMMAARAMTVKLAYQALLQQQCKKKSKGPDDLETLKELGSIFVDHMLAFPIDHITVEDKAPAMDW